MAYIGDSTSEDERSGGMGILGAAMGVGIILGPGLGGLLGAGSLSMPFFIAGGMSLLTLGLIAAFLPESLPPEKRQPAQEQSQSTTMRDLWDATLSPLGILLCMAFLMTCGLMIFYSIFGLYASAKFNYGPGEVGVVFMVFGLVSAIAQDLLAGLSDCLPADLPVQHIPGRDADHRLLHPRHGPALPGSGIADLQTRHHGARPHHGLEQCLRQPGPPRRAAAGWHPLRPAHRISLLQRGSDYACRFLGQFGVDFPNYSPEQVLKSPEDDSKQISEIVALIPP